MHNKTKKIISLLLSLVMVLSVFGGMTFTAGATYHVGNTVEFGSYPQTALEYGAELDWLRDHWNEFEWKSYGYYSGTGKQSNEGERLNPGDFIW